MPLVSPTRQNWLSGLAVRPAHGCSTSSTSSRTSAWLQRQAGRADLATRGAEGPQEATQTRTALADGRIVHPAAARASQPRLVLRLSLPRHRGPPWLESHTSGRTTSKGEDQDDELSSRCFVTFITVAVARFVMRGFPAHAQRNFPLRRRAPALSRQLPLGPGAARQGERPEGQAPNPPSG